MITCHLQRIQIQVNITINRVLHFKKDDQNKK